MRPAAGAYDAMRGLPPIPDEGVRGDPQLSYAMKRATTEIEGERSPRQDPDKDMMRNPI